ncbi:MAG TPA: Hpt domain-containing protein [Caulobacteraceae bacterium]|jgi:HPt (histidine-containing phosphotransfer) domain-containing protein
MNDAAAAGVPADVAAAVARLRARFLERAAGERDDLQRWSADLDGSRGLARPLVHRIAGAAGTFGFARLSEVAKIAEDALISGAPGRHAAIAELIAELDRALCTAAT